jgi:hypothetical protein
MQAILHARNQFPPEVIRHATWLYLRFTFSYRDVEEPLAERSLDVSYETVRHWVLKFGPAFTRNLRRLRPALGSELKLADLPPSGRGWIHRLGRSETDVDPRADFPSSAVHLGASICGCSRLDA